MTVDNYNMYFSLKFININILNIIKRLKARGYSEKKITENIECEILEVSSEEVYESYDNDVIIELKNEKESDV